MSDVKRNLGIREGKDRAKKLKELALARDTSVQALVDFALDLAFPEMASIGHQPLAISDNEMGHIGIDNPVPSPRVTVSTKESNTVETGIQSGNATAGAVSTGRAEGHLGSQTERIRMLQEELRGLEERFDAIPSSNKDAGRAGPQRKPADRKRTGSRG